MNELEVGLGVTGLLQSEVATACLLLVAGMVAVLIPVRVNFMIRVLGAVLLTVSSALLTNALPELYGRPRPAGNFAEVSSDIWVDGFLIDRDGGLRGQPAIYLWGRKNDTAKKEAESAEKAKQLKEKMVGKKAGQQPEATGDDLKLVPPPEGWVTIARQQISGYLRQVVNESREPLSFVIPFDKKVAQFLEAERKGGKGKPFRAKVRVAPQTKRGKFKGVAAEGDVRVIIERIPENAKVID